MPLDFEELRQLLLTLAQTDIAELTLKSDDFELTVRKAVGAKNQLTSTVESGTSNMAGLAANSPQTASSTAAPGMESLSSRMIDNNVNTSMQLPLAVPLPLEQKLAEISSPMVGTFYRAPAPGEPSFVEVGDRVRVGQTVCIIEAMKLMNEIEAEVSGQITEILVQNGEPIEYGQPLMRINPD